MKKHKLLRFLGILLLVLAALLALLVLAGSLHLAQKPSQPPDLTGDGWHQLADGTLMADGVAYRPRKGLTTLLGIGLGSSQDREESGWNRGMMPMADTFVVAVADRSRGELSLLAIPRDTQVPLRTAHSQVPLPDGQIGHLALQYRYGGSDRVSCTDTTAETVSQLLHGVGISGCLTIDMDSISAFADWIGGVPITVPDDPWYCAYTDYQPGQWIAMDGPTALQFVQYRDTNVPGSCEMRVERQKVFLDALLSWGVKRLRTQPWQIPACLWALRPYYYTDLSPDEIAALAFSLLRTQVREVSMLTLPGAVVQGEIYEEYHVDPSALRQQLLDLYYEPVPEA